MAASEPPPRELVLSALRGDPVPRAPTGPLAVHFCARLAGHSLEDYSTDPRVLAASVLRYHETFRPDAVWLSADTWVTAEAMGAAVTFPAGDQPACGTGEPLVKRPGDVGRIPPPDPSRQGRLPLMLEAAGRIAEGLRGEAALVACFDQYPFSLAGALLGMNGLMLKLTDDPPLVEALMERCLEYASAYAAALAGCGADVLSGGDSPAGLLGPERYRRVALPFEKRLIERLHATVPQPVSLHICGDTTRLISGMAASGADVLEIDHQVDLEAAAGAGVALWGNLDAAGLLLRGRPDEVRRAARRALAATMARGHSRFILSSGCTLAPGTPPENVRALIEAARRFMQPARPP